MVNTPSSSGPESGVNDNAIPDRQLRTRDKVFATIGNTVELGIDTAVFATKTGAYGLGRAVHGLAKTTRAGVQGAMGKRYEQAA